MIGFIVLNLILSTFTRYESLNTVWLVITGLQLFMYTPLLSLYFPGNCFLVFNEMIRVASLDFLPSSWMLSGLFQFESNNNIDEKLSRFGNFNSGYMILGIGSVLFIALWHCLLFLLLTIMSISRSVRSTKAYSSLRKKLFLSEPIIVL